MSKLTIEIGARIEALQRGLSNARASLNNFSKSVSSSMSTGAKAGIAAMAGGVAMILQKSVQLAAAMEQTQVSFKVMTGSADKARAMVEALTAFANSTPFESAEIMKSAKVLMGFGVAAKDILPTLRLLGDVSAGTGKDLTELSVIFGQIRGNGKLMGGDLLQLINGGFNPLSIIAKQTGRSMADLRKDMEAGLITFEMVEGAFKSATSEGGLFFNMMQEQSATLNGKLSTLSDAMAKIGVGIGTAFLDELKMMADQAIKLADALEDINKAKGLTSPDAEKPPAVVAAAPTLENELPVGYREGRDKAALAVANVFEVLEKSINAVLPEGMEGESAAKVALRKLVDESKKQLELEGKLSIPAPTATETGKAEDEAEASRAEADKAKPIAEREAAARARLAAAEKAQREAALPVAPPATGEPLPPWMPQAGNSAEASAKANKEIEDASAQLAAVLNEKMSAEFADFGMDAQDWFGAIPATPEPTEPTTPAPEAPKDEMGATVNRLNAVIASADKALAGKLSKEDRSDVEKIRDTAQAAINAGREARKKQDEEKVEAKKDFDKFFADAEKQLANEELDEKKVGLQKQAQELEKQIGDMFRPQEIIASRLANVGGERGIVMERQQVPEKQLEVLKQTLAEIKKVEVAIKELNRDPTFPGGGR